MSSDRRKYRTYREWGAVRCGIEFSPEVKIDLVVRAKEERKAAEQTAKAEMIENAHEAAAVQQDAEAKASK